MQEPTRPHVGENLGKTGVLGKRGRVACPGISRLGNLGASSKPQKWQGEAAQTRHFSPNAPGFPPKSPGFPQSSAVGWSRFSVVFLGCPL